MPRQSALLAPISRRIIAVLALALVVGFLPSSPSVAVEAGNEAACTPGYWKNHTDNWIERIRNDGTPVYISTDTLIGDIFTSASADYADDTFLEALNYKGGDVERTLLKHAVAAYLNAAYDDDAGNLKYPLRRYNSSQFYPDFDGIVPEVNAALDTGDRETILALKDFLDGIANDLDCPLN